MIIELEVKEGLHIPPKLIDFNTGSFQKICVCEDCKMNVAEVGINQYAPCENCGGNFSGFLSYTGKYDRKLKKWCKRVKIKGRASEESCGFVGI